MFTYESKAQRLAVCRIIEGWLQRTGYWQPLMADAGPAAALWERRTTERASTGQRVLIDLLAIVWTDQPMDINYRTGKSGRQPGNDWLCQAIATLDPAARADVAGLVGAMLAGATAVAAWLEKTTAEQSKS